MTDQAPMFPFMHLDPCMPPLEYAELRRAESVTRVMLPTGCPAWLATRHEDVHSILSDPRFSREALTSPDAPPLLPMPSDKNSIFFMDPPRQTRLRQLAASGFTLERARRLQPRIERIVEGLLDSMAASGSPADLLTHLAKPLPIMVLCALLGVADKDVDSLRAWIDVMFDFGAQQPEAMMAAHQKVNGYLIDLIACKRAQPADDLLTDLINAHDGEDQLAEGELIAFVYDLLGAGTQPVTAEIVHSVLALLRKPSLFRLLQDQPELLPTAVEELLRHSQSAGGGLGSLRLATENVNLGNVTICAGEGVIPSLNAANFDASVFADPNDLDLGRTPNPHLTFGEGIHRCVGIHIGRIELQVIFAALARRFPQLRLATPENELVWSPGMAFRTPRVLSVAW